MGIDVTGFGAVADFARDMVDRFFPSKTEEEKQNLALIVTTLNGQFAANATEAANPHLFVAGWRPFIGWVCGSGFAIQFVVGPLAQWLSALAGHPLTFPALDLGTMMPLLLGMLGLGGLRTAEKISGKAQSLTAGK